MRFLGLIITAVWLAACADSSSDKCGNRFLLPMDDGHGAHSLQEVELKTLNSPYQMRGSVAEIFFEAKIDDQGLSGSQARPKLTRNGNGVCLPMDAGSGSALTAYAHFERIKEFDSQLAVVQNVSWPRKVGVQIHLIARGQTQHNNAHYFSHGDATVIVPYTGEGLPLAANGAILAHEHFHAHFQSQVIGPMNQALKQVLSLEDLFYANFGLMHKPIEDLDSSDPRSIRGLNNFTIRSWNEGLADFYAAVFSRNARFLENSLPRFADRRDLTGFVRSFGSLKNLPRHFWLGHDRVVRDSLVEISYDQGTNLSRLLFQLVGENSDQRKLLLQQVMTTLKDLPNILGREYSVRAFEFEQVVPHLIKGIALSSEKCELLRRALSKDLLAKEFDQCLK